MKFLLSASGDIISGVYYGCLYVSLHTIAPEILDQHTLKDFFLDVGYGGGEINLDRFFC